MSVFLCVCLLVPTALSSNGNAFVRTAGFGGSAVGASGMADEYGTIGLLIVVVVWIATLRGRQK